MSNSREVDQMVLEFPITADYQMLPFDGYKIFVTHGHLYDENLKWVGEQDAVLFGHIHIPVAEKINGLLYLNPGSISLPKMESVPSYGVLVNDVFTIYDLDKNIVNSYKIK